MTKYLDLTYENGRILSVTPAGQVVHALAKSVMDYSCRLPAVRKLSFKELKEKTDRGASYVGKDFSELEIYIDDVMTHILEASENRPDIISLEATGEFLIEQKELRELLGTERAKVTQSKLMVQEHFMAVVGTLWNFVGGSSTRRNINFIEEPFHYLAIARDNIFDEWSSDNLHRYFELSDKLMALSGYGNWCFHAEREFYHEEEKFPTLQKIRALRDDIEVDELWRTRNES